MFVCRRQAGDRGGRRVGFFRVEGGVDDDHIF
jgi:hypothetical protein